MGVDSVVGSVEQALKLLVGRQVIGLTGAGLSTDSGIPDYRSPDAPRATPMTYQEFRSSARARQRYWARSHVGWTRMRGAVPNAGHRALVELEKAGALRGLITQNVDGLHRAAGQRCVIDLHGRLSDVICLDCRRVTRRTDLQQRLVEMNPDFAEEHRTEAISAPDGDAALDTVDGFQVAPCRSCGGILKPDVVFFGENVPPERVALCGTLIESLSRETGALLVAGTSLAVQSGLRFVRHAHRLDIPVVIINRGRTRGDELATIKIDGSCSSTLTTLRRTVCPFAEV